MSVKDLRQAAADTTQAAAERGTELVQEAIARLQPLVEQAGERVGPVAHDAKVKTADFAARTLDAWQPGIQDALEKVTPAVDAARLRVQDDLLPKLSDLLHQAAEHPDVAKAVEEAETPKKKSKIKRAAKVIAIGALAAAAIAAVRQFLTSKDDGWTAHEPSKAYVNSTNNFSNESAPEAAPAEAEAEAEAPADEVVDAEEVTEASADAPENSYVGENPPEGFTIKGNERSMKYHLPGTGGFERTIPDVWFSSEEAAQAAGFTKAQR